MKKSTKVLLSTSLITALMMTSLYTPAVQADETLPNPSPIDKTIDSDGDGLTDYSEIEVSNPSKQDSDNDGVLDGAEDADRDGLTNLEEQTAGTKLVLADSDGDGLKDSEEVKTYNTDPLQSDMDRDHLDDGTEILLKLDPRNKDVDGDGVLDGDVNRAYPLPNNKFNITGTMTGKSNVPKRVIVRESPKLLVQQIPSALTFDIFTVYADAI